MAAYSGHFASPCFEHINTYITGTARDGSMKFHEYIDFDGGYTYMKQKVYRYDFITGSVK